MEPGRVRLGQRVLLGGGPGRLAGLDGVVLRLVRRRERHHGGQTACRAVDDRPLRAPCLLYTSRCV
ncbi:hypothetical protein [Arthrobacter sp. KBS0703]|uniref:hypothetical protein n=1 Tax=Arthrobacter sp. KBS0703 TaxID=1955698 RepID=UPI00163DD7B9